MTWHLIRLDLARSAQHPQGSHEHCYLVRLPLDARGFIDRAELKAHPDRATVLRSRPDEPERSGHVGRSAGEWVFSYAPGEGDDERLFRLETHPLQRGDYLTVIDTGRESFCFEVVACHETVPA